MGPGLLPFDWIPLMVGGESQTAPQEGPLAFRAAPGMGVVFASYFYCHLFNQGLGWNLPAPKRKTLWIFQPSE